MNEPWNGQIERQRRGRERVGFSIRERWVDNVDALVVEKRNFLLSQLSSLSYADKHIKERRRRHPRTGVWLTETDEFKEWMARDCSACLWCYGIRK
jgi:hypothetical protein